MLQPDATYSDFGFDGATLGVNDTSMDRGSVAEAVVGADAVLILTEWRQYRELNWQELAGRMRRPAWVFDSRAVTDPEQVRAAGLTLWRVGDGEG